MDKLLYLLLGAGIIFIIYTLRSSFAKRKSAAPDAATEEMESQNDTPDYSRSYQIKYLLTKNEWSVAGSD